MPNKTGYFAAFRPVGLNPWSIAFKRRRCASAFALVVPLAWTACGVRTTYFPESVR